MSPFRRLVYYDTGGPGFLILRSRVILDSEARPVLQYPAFTINLNQRASITPSASLPASGLCWPVPSPSRQEVGRDWGTWR